MPLLVTLDGTPHILFGGEPDFPEQKYAAIEWRPVPVHAEGMWLSSLEPFTPGMVVTMTGLDEHMRELFRLTSPPLHAGKLESARPR